MAKNTADWGKDKAKSRVAGYKRGGAVNVTVNVAKPAAPALPPLPMPPLPGPAAAGGPPVPPPGGAGPPFKRGGVVSVTDHAGSGSGVGRKAKSKHGTR